MIRNSCIRPLLLVALLLLPGALFAAQDDPPRATQSNRYEIRFMDIHAAEVMAWDQCIQKDRCKITALAITGDSNFRGYLEVTAEPAVQEKIARALAKADGIPHTQSFQLLLLAADAKAGNQDAGIPANAQKALDDLKGFLPYKSFELLDAVWLRGTQDRTVQSRLAGRGGHGYEARLRFRSVGNPADKNLFFDTFHIRDEAHTPRPPAADGADGPRLAPQPIRDLISTTFGIKVGETLVVGTSKMNGTNEALIVLITAVPSP
jgi:hypothetical protein